MKKMQKTFQKHSLAGVLLISALGLSACDSKQNVSDQVVATPPAMQVQVVEVVSEPVTLKRELPGRVSAYRIAEVRARVDGIVEKRLFEEGSDVAEGDVLFQIDAAPYRAALDSAKARLASVEANYASAKSQATRVKALVETNAVSKQNYDDAVSAELSLKAEIAVAEAAVRTAEINLGYTQVRAPISGRIGRAGVTEGAYVQGATATLLATIQQLDPLYVDVTQSAEDVLRLKSAVASGAIEGSSTDKVMVNVYYADGTPYPETGSLEFSDVTVDSTTGMVTLRAVLPNPNVDLLPGMFVRAEIEEGVDPKGILVSHSLVSRNSKGDALVRVVSPENTVELRTIQTARSMKDAWLVSSGLEVGDLIIADNLQKIRAGMAVTPRRED
jgi:membrane fusion protein (multidrug efflux system)